MVELKKKPAGVATGDATDKALPKKRAFPVLLGLEGPLRNQRFALNKKDISIGRDMNADILVRDNRTSRRHARVVYSNIEKTGEPKELRIFDEGTTNGTFVNGQKVGSEGVLLREKDKVKVGKSVFCVLLQDDDMDVNRKLEEMATRDELTGMLNLPFFKQNLTSEAARAKRYKRPLSLVALEVNAFREIIEKYGTTSRETILKKLAEFLKKFCRTNDLATRLSGGDLLLALPETNQENADLVTRRIQKAVRELVIMHGNTAIQIQVTASAVEWEWKYSSVDDFIKEAQRALQQAHQAGRPNGAEDTLTGE